MKIDYNGTIELDWYKDYPIEIQPSCTKMEEYSDGSKIPHIHFGFYTSSYWFSLGKAKKICTMIEQIRLFVLLSPNTEIEFKTFSFPIKATCEPPIRIEEERLEDWGYYSSAGSQLEAALRGFNLDRKIIYQQRRQWQYKLYDDVPQDYKAGQTVLITGRFEFVILPKDAKRIINI